MTRHPWEGGVWKRGVCICELVGGNAVELKTAVFAVRAVSVRELVDFPKAGIFSRPSFLLAAVEPGARMALLPATESSQGVDQADDGLPIAFRERGDVPEPLPQAAGIRIVI